MRYVMAKNTIFTTIAPPPVVIAFWRIFSRGFTRDALVMHMLTSICFPWVNGTRVYSTLLLSLRSSAYGVHSTRTPSGKESRKLVGWYCDLLVYFFLRKRDWPASLWQLMTSVMTANHRASCQIRCRQLRRFLLQLTVIRYKSWYKTLKAAIPIFKPRLSKMAKLFSDFQIVFNSWELH